MNISLYNFLLSITEQTWSFSFFFLFFFFSMKKTVIYEEKKRNQRISSNFLESFFFKRITNEIDVRKKLAVRKAVSIIMIRAQDDLVHRIAQQGNR